jgi:hypothetical protein
MQFYKRTSGHMGQYEDWWTLSERDGVKTVIHNWEHMRVNGLNQTTGQNECSLEEFLSGSHHGGAQAALRKVLEA